MPTSKALTRFSKNVRTSLKFSRPILQEPSTRITISAMASVWHTNWSAEEREERSKKEMMILIRDVLFAPIREALPDSVTVIQAQHAHNSVIVIP